MLYIPGQGNIRVITQSGTKYDLEIRAAAYNFAESVSVAFDAGDEEYSEQEEQDDIKETIRALSVRRANATKWGAFSTSS